MRKFFIENKGQIILFLAIIAVVIGILTFIRIQEIDDKEKVIINKPTDKSSGSNETEINGNLIRVDIQGCVKHPGVYEFKEGQIVDDAIKESGGLTEDANMEFVNRSINRAEKLSDQQKIYIPAKGEEINTENSSNILAGNQSSGKININTASLEELDLLPGIGPSFAGRIIDGRPYSNIEDIKKVKGIGESTYQKLKDLITV